MLLNEALRLYPSLVISRKAEQDDEIGGYSIQRDGVSLSPYTMHRHLHSGRVGSFRPRAFQPAHSESRPSYAYFPSGWAAPMYRA